MALAVGQFERIAGIIAERTSDLIAAEVSIVDDRGVVVASSDPSMHGRLMDLSVDETGKSYVGVPLTIASRSGTVLVDRKCQGELISPRLTTVLVDMVINQTMVVDQLPNKQELKGKLIHDLLHGEIDNEAAILREGQILGMDLREPRLVILIDASDYILRPTRDHQPPSENRIVQRAQVVIGSVVDFFHLPNDTICAYIGEGEVAVLKASTLRALSAWAAHEGDPTQYNPGWANLAALKRATAALLEHVRSSTRSSISIGIGRHHPGISGLARSYQDARAALSLGRRFHGRNQVHCLDSLGMAAFVGVADERTKVDLATYLLSPLDHEPDFLATLQAFFELDCCPSAVARALSIHRNTLSYRLDKITSLTGLDPRRFDDAVQIRLALLLRTLQAEPNCANA